VDIVLVVCRFVNGLVNVWLTFVAVVALVFTGVLVSCSGVTLREIFE